MMTMTLPKVASNAGDSHFHFVELVGLAGAGKSTLAAALPQQVEQIERIAPPDLRDLSNIPFFLWSTLRMVPTFTAIIRECGWKAFSRREMGIMIILNGWADQVTARFRGKKSAVLVDQGPISYLAMLKRRNSPWQSTRAGQQWLKKMLDRWSQVVSVVVMLDASNEVLVQRIRSRTQEHSLQNATFEEASDVLELYRVIYPRVIAALESRNPRLNVLSYITTSKPKDMLHQEVAKDLREAITNASKGASK